MAIRINENIFSLFVNRNLVRTGKDLEQASAPHNQMVDSFNTQYVGRPSSPESQQATDKINAQQMVVKEKQGRVNQSSDEIARQKALLPEIKARMNAFVS